MDDHGYLEVLGSQGLYFCGWAMLAPSSVGGGVRRGTGRSLASFRAMLKLLHAYLRWLRSSSSASKKVPARDAGDSSPRLMV
jgi:hypothetical protein